MSNSRGGFLQFDIFRKLPKEVTEPTFCGAVMSFICTTVLIILTISEVKDYLGGNTASTMEIDTSHRSDKF